MRCPASLPAPRLTPLLALLTLILLPVPSVAAPLQPAAAIGPRLAPPAQPAGTEGPSPAATAAGATTDWWSQVQRDLERQEYAGSATEDGWQAPNRAQNLRARFQSAGVDVASRAEGTWRWHWETTAWGRDESMRGVSPVAPISCAGRIEYPREGLVEWYENRKEGLEQGFTLTSRPSGEGRLRIRGRVAAELHPRASADGEAVDFLDAQGACVLRYGKLMVRDARGAKLEARLNVADDALEIDVDDREATYPLTIDPLMTSPAWTAESDQASAFFGYSVATAGDVNGDGYSDVIVGANGYDCGQSDEGRAIVYLGSASGLATTAAWSAESDQVGAAFGVSVASAGDINGDGYADVIVGAYQ